MKVVLNNIRYCLNCEREDLLPMDGTVVELEIENIYDAAKEMDRKYMVENDWLLESYSIEIFY